MKVKEFMEKFNIDNDKAMELIEYKEYLPIAEKYVLASTCADACMSVDRNGVYSVNTFQLHLAFITKMVTTYTNLEIEPDETCEAYDLLCENEIMSDILTHIKGEYDAVQDIMNGYISDKLSYENSTAKIISEGMDAIFNAVGESGNSLVEVLNGALSGIDMTKVAGAISKLN